MSGGSYNYLCYTNTLDISNKTDELIQMCNRLKELGFEDVYNDSLEVLNSVRDYEKKIDDKIDKVSKIWKAVEWMDSGDWSLECVNEEINNYRKKQNGKKKNTKRNS